MLKFGDTELSINKRSFSQDVYDNKINYQCQQVQIKQVQCAALSKLNTTNISLLTMAMKISHHYSLKS